MEVFAWAAFLWLYFFIRIHSYTLIILSIYYVVVSLYLFSLRINGIYDPLDNTSAEKINSPHL
jgi:hypothetical protein